MNHTPLTICGLVAAAISANCGGANAVQPPPPPPPPPQPCECPEPQPCVCPEPADPNVKGIRIQKPAGSSTAYDGGLYVFRDAFNVSGGTPGNVNTAVFSRTRTGAEQKAFEWSGLFLMDNYSNYGENVALYAQGNAYGAGPTWGLVAEVNNAYSPNATSVGQEITMGMTGADNGNRIGLDVVVHDGKAFRGLGSSTVVEATAGVRVATSLIHPQAKFTYGVKLQGNLGTAIDTTEANTQTAIKLAPGQKIDMGNGVTIDYANNAIRFMKNGVVIHNFPM